MAVLIDENFRGLTGTRNGDAVSTTTVPAADLVTGGTNQHSTDWNLDPTGFSMLTSGTASAMVQWALSSRANTYIQGYFILNSTVAASNYFNQVRDGTDAAVTAQLGFTTSNQIRMRDVATAVGSNLPIVLGQEYRYWWQVLGGTTQTLYLWTGHTLHSPSIRDASASTSGACSTTTSSRVQVGQVVTSAAMSVYLAQFRADSTTQPQPTLIDATGRRLYRQAQLVGGGL